MTKIVRVLKYESRSRGKASAVFGIWDTDSNTGKVLSLLMPPDADAQVWADSRADDLFNHPKARLATNKLRLVNRRRALQSELPEKINPADYEGITTLLQVRTALVEIAKHIELMQLDGRIEDTND